MLEPEWRELVHAIMEFKDYISARRYIGKDLMIYYHRQEAVLTSWKQEGISSLSVTRLVFATDEFSQLKTFLLAVGSALRGLTNTAAYRKTNDPPFVFVYYTFGESHGCYTDKEHCKKVADSWGERVVTHIREIPGKRLLLQNIYKYLIQRQLEQFGCKNSNFSSLKEKQEAFLVAGKDAKVTNWDIVILYINLMSFWHIQDDSEHYLCREDLHEILQISTEYLIKGEVWYVYKTLFDALQCKHHHSRKPKRLSSCCVF